MSAPPPASFSPNAPFRRADVIVLAILVAIYLIYCSYGFLAPFWWGHYGYHGAEHMLKVRNTLRFHMIDPARWTGFDPPILASYYLHRPIGYHYVILPLRVLFGEHEWVAKLTAVLGGMVGGAGLATLAKRWWSPTAAVWIVMVYISLPILGSFAVLPDPTLMIIGVIAFSIDAFLQFRLTPTRRVLWRAIGFAFVSSWFMWEPYFAALPLLAWMLSAWIFHRGPAPRIAFGTWRLPAPLAYILGVGLSFGISLGFHLWLVARAGDWANLLGAYSSRSGTRPAVWGAIREWTAINYGTPPLVIGALWLLVFVIRLAMRRVRSRDVVPLLFLYVNSLYVVLFPGSFVVHLYLVFFLLGFFVFAVIDLASTFEAVLRELGKPRAGIIVGALAVAAFVCAELPHTVHNIRESRELMGTHGIGKYSPQQDRLLFAAAITKATDTTDRVMLHLNVLFRKEFWYYMDRSFDEVPSIPDIATYKNAKQYVIAVDERALSAGDRQRFEQLAKQHPVTLYGQWAIVDLRREGAAVRCRNFVSKPASTAWRWWVSPTVNPMALEPRHDCPGLPALAAKHLPILDD